MTVPFYLHGADVAWQQWAWDFTPDGNGGIASRPDAARDVFERGKAMGARVLRWWLLPGAQTDANGNTRWFDDNLRIRDGITTDIDAALALAEAYDLHLQFCIFSGPQDVKAWIDDPIKRAQLVDGLLPLFEHYAQHPRLLTWELFNETDIGIWYKGANEAATLDTVRLFAQAAKAAQVRQYLTSSCGMCDGFKLLANVGLTLYQCHWYPYMDNGGTARGDWYLPGRTRASLNTQYNLNPALPLVVGEFYAGPTNTTPGKHWDVWRANGFDGAYAWSLMWESTNDKMQIDYAVAKAFIDGTPLPPDEPPPPPDEPPPPGKGKGKKKIKVVTTRTEEWIED